MGTLDGMSAVIAGGPAAGALMPPLGCVLCLAWVFSSWCLHVNFPTKVMFKSSKLIPTMQMGLTILKKTYSIKGYLAAFILVAGVIEFSLVDAKG